MSRRRRFTPHFKAQVVLEDLTGAKSTAEICREHRLRLQLLSRWKAESIAWAPEVSAAEQSASE